MERKQVLIALVMLLMLGGLAETTMAGIVTYTYDPSIGTLPDAQGWTEVNDPSAAVSLVGDVLSVQSTQAGLQYWSLIADPFLYTDRVVINATLRINSSSYRTSPVVRAGYYLGIMDNSLLPGWTSISDTGVYFHYEGEVSSSFVPVALNDGQFHHFKMVADSTGFDLFIDNVQYIDEPFRTGVDISTPANFLSFGDQSRLGQSDIELLFYQATIGGVDNDLFFNAVTPCRIVDTRRAEGAFPPGGIRSYNVRGAVASQGGNSAGCPSALGEPHGVHLNVTAVPVSGSGNIGIFPHGLTPPNASFVNYKTDVQNIANSGAIKTCYNCGKDISIVSNFGTAHVVIDVMGYYNPAP